MTLAGALRSFQDHAAVNYPQTQGQADHAWLTLEQHLTRDELDDVCARIRKARGL